MLEYHARKLLQCAEGKTPLDIAFSLVRGEFLTIHGKSGAGKTTILRMLSGLLRADGAEIVVDGEVWDSTERRIHLPVQKRSIGFVFQDFALFPNLTVRGNLAYALPQGGDSIIIDELLELMELRVFEKARPTALSGGQQQRVALARAIVRKPKILLLDEPLSALDDEMRLKLQEYILRVHRRFNLTTILVSHHIPEIFRMSTRVLVLGNGKIEKTGKPEEVFSSRNLSSKFRLTGEIVGIRKADLVTIISVLAGNDIVRVVATDDEVGCMSIGTKVLVASKAFNPIITVVQ